MKQYLVIILAIVLALLSGCAQDTTIQQAREKAEKRWSHTRAQMVCGIADEHLKVGQLDKAHAKALESMSLDEAYAPSHILLGKIYIEQGNFAAAITEMDRASILEPTNPDPVYLMAVAQEKDGQLETALENYRRTYTMQNSNLAPVIAAAEVMILMGRTHEARCYIETFINKAGNETAMYELAGRLAMMERDYSSASLYYQQAHDLDPRNFRYAEFLATVQFKDQKFEDAAQVLNDLLANEQYKPSAGIYVLLGDCNIAQKKLNQARVAYTKARDLEPNSAQIWAGLAKIALEMNDHQRAVLSARSALEIEPNNLDASLILGFAILKQGNSKAAVDILEKAVQDHPQSSVLYCVLGKAYATSGQADKAEDCYKIAVQLEPQNQLAQQLASAPASKKLGDN